jgi:hypothetical protein
MKYAVLVNTCDNFSDCWDPFFKLWSLYWPDCKGQVFLNTEYKNYRYGALEITPLKVCEIHLVSRSRRITWSQCLKWALEEMEGDIVLYMQEDYFLKDYVKNDIVEGYVQMMMDHKKIDCIHLTDQGAPAGEPSEFKNLNYVPGVHPDRISCQAALWRKDVLLQYIRVYESGWNFEWWGSKRAAVLNHNFFAVNSNWVQKGKFEILPYLFTGVIGGKWLDEVVPLFEKHQISMDFSKRGFYKVIVLPVMERIRRKVKRVPVECRSLWGVFLLKVGYK